jgi:hypothetical protein
MFKLCWYELGNEKKCELQHHFNVFLEKSLDLVYKSGHSTTLFGLV